MKALGLDPGFAFFGWGIVRLNPRLELVDAGCARTKKNKRKVLATDDNIVRGRELWRALDELWSNHHPVVIATESMSWPRNASVTGKMGIAWGILISFAERYELPVVAVSPQNMKKKLVGKNSASKAEVRKAVLATQGFVRLAGLLDKTLPVTQHEHPIDAVGAVLTSLDTDVFRAFRRGNPG